jgi:hypothetical protein
MRRDCRLIDAVRFVAGNLFADRLFKIFKICEGLTLLTLRAAATICDARSDRVLTAAPTYAQTSAAVDRAKSESSARKNWSGVAVATLLGHARSRPHNALSFAYRRFYFGGFSGELTKLDGLSGLITSGDLN